MRITFFTEGGEKTGLGHLSRCLALSGELHKKKIKVKTIVCGDELARGFCVKSRNPALFFDWAADKKKTENTVKASDCVIIDSYRAGIRIYRFICRILEQRIIPGRAVYVDDDLRLDYPQGMIINPNIYGSSLFYDKKDRFLLLGEKYIILRSTFRTAPAARIRKKIKNVLINLGGTAGNKIINKVYNSLKDIDPAVDFHILSPRFKGDHKIKARVYPFLSASGVKNLMLKCDLCVSGGGQSLSESARIGLPVIGICLAQNQTGNLEAFRQKGYIEYAGWYNDPEFTHNLKKAFFRSAVYEKRKEKSRKGRDLVDGKGAQRIAEEIVKWIKK